MHEDLNIGSIVHYAYNFGFGGPPVCVSAIVNHVYDQAMGNVVLREFQTTDIKSSLYTPLQDKIGGTWHWIHEHDADHQEEGLSEEQERSMIKTLCTDISQRIHRGLINYKTDYDAMQLFLLIQIFNTLQDISASIESMSNDSWNDHHCH